MPKLTRYLQKIFANNSNEVGVFGTGVDKETSKNVETLQSADYENGWSSAIITNKNYPIWQEMDGVQYGLSYQIKYLEQSGIPEWISTETYYTNSYCRVGSNIYYSLQDDNTNHNPALNDGWWTLLLASKADTDLSNLNTTGQHVIDGQWVASYLNLANTAPPASTDLEYSLATYLPDDDYDYEVLFTVASFTASTTAAAQTITLATDLMGSVRFTSVVPRTNNSYRQACNGILPVGSGRKVIVEAVEGNAGTFILSAEGYRRIGTNQ